MIPDFENWMQERPLAPGTKIRFDAKGWGTWWHGLESTIIAKDSRPNIYRVAAIKNPAGRLEEYSHRDTFVVIDP